ncbi:MAG: hypothetical protein ACKOFI_06430, partial [Phycisphaerales bacterium]
MRMDPPALAQDAPGIALAGGAAGGVAVAGAAPGAGALDPLVMEEVRLILRAAVAAGGRAEQPVGRRIAARFAKVGF